MSENMSRNDDRGYWLQTGSCGEYRPLRWYSTKKEADKDLGRMLMLGQWQALVPRLARYRHHTDLEPSEVYTWNGRRGESVKQSSLSKG